MKNKISNQYKEKYQNVNLSGFYENRYNSLVKCDEPLIVIASVMRSGGNLLNRLLDGHKQLRTYHSELLFGVMSDISSTNEALNISRFPIFQSELDFNNIFNALTENDPFIEQAMQSGWVKVNYDRPLPFCYDRKFHRDIFLKLCEYGVKGNRDILNNFVTGFFNSYLDCQGLYEKKKYTTTYWPEFLIYNKNIEDYFSVYPDGKIISIIRNPLQWAGSAKKRSPNLFNLQYMDELWLESVNMTLSLKDKYKDNIILLNLDDLVLNTTATMNELSSFLGLDFQNEMIEPTINSMPVEANSINNELQVTGIVSDVLKSYEKVLSANDISDVTKRYFPVYEFACSKSLMF